MLFSFYYLCKHSKKCGMQDRERILSLNYIGTYNQLRTVYRTFYGFTLFHVFVICLTTLFGILAMVLSEVLLINNKKDTSQFLKSISNAYVFLCRIVGTPLYSMFESVVYKHFTLILLCFLCVALLKDFTLSRHWSL